MPRIAADTTSLSVTGLRRRSRWARAGLASRTFAQPMECLGLLSCVTGGRRGDAKGEVKRGRQAWAFRER